MKLLRMFPVFLFCFSFMFISCDEETSGPVEFEDSKTVTTLILEITDRRTDAPIDSVLVKIIDSGSVYTDTSGIAKLTNLATGTYQIVCEKSGYETIAFTQTLSLGGYTDMPILPEYFNAKTMTKKGVSISGTVYYDALAFRGLTLADNAVVECILPNNLDFNTKYRSINTSLTGAFKFDSLPEYTTYTFSIKPYKKNGNLYKTNANITILNNGNISAGDSLVIAPINLYESTDSIQIVVHNLDTMGLTDSAKIVFSEAVNLTILTPDSIYLTDNTIPFNKKIPAHFIWSPAVSSNILQIIPLEGTWDKTMTYRLYIGSIRSATDKILSKGTPGTGWDNTNSYYEFTIPMKGSLAKIDSLKYCITLGDTLTKADHNTGSIFLYWPALANAKNYQVYKKRPQDLQWMEITNSPVLDTFTNVSTSEWFKDGDSTRFFVIGANTDTTSPIDTSIYLTVKDETKPTPGAALVLNKNTPGGFDRTLIVTPDTILVDIITLSEPMDTTKDPIITTFETGGTAVLLPATNCAWVWSSETVGHLHVRAEASVNSSGDSIVVNFNVCADKAGNLFDTTSTDGFIQSYKTQP